MIADNDPIADIHAYMTDLGRRARAASRLLARASTGEKNAALLAIAADLESNAEALMAENAKDLAAGCDKGLEPAPRCLTVEEVCDHLIAERAAPVVRTGRLHGSRYPPLYPSG